MRRGRDNPTDIPFLFQEYQQIVNAATLKAEMQKILSLSEHEASEHQSSNADSLNVLAFFPNNFMAKRHLKSLP